MYGNTQRLSPRPGFGAGMPARPREHGWLPMVLAWVLILLMTVPDNFDYARLSQEAAPESGGAVSRVLWLFLLFGGLAAIAQRMQIAWLLLRQMNVWLLAFVALSLLSIAWSIEPAVTARRCLRVVTILVDSVALMLAGWHAHRFQAVCRSALMFILLGSIAFGIAEPTLAIHQEDSRELVGAWRGLANHKNTFGVLASMSAVLWMHGWLAGETSRLRALLGTVLAVICLVLSRSSTAMMTTLFAVGFLGFTQRASPALRPYIPYLIGSFAALLLLYAMAVLHLLPGSNTLLKPVIMLTGKDQSFTGRSEIWAIVLDHIHQQPWLGNGLGAYWIGDNKPLSPSYEMVRLLAFYPGSAHSGYLEILNDLGSAGLLCLVGYMVVYLRQAITILRIDVRSAALFFALFLQQAITNLSESHWLTPLSLGFVIMTMSSASQARLLLDAALRRHHLRVQAARTAASPVHA